MATYQAEFTRDGQAVRCTVQGRDMAAALRKLRRDNPGATGLQVWLAPTACASSAIEGREVVTGKGERLTMADGSQWLHPFNGGAPVCEILARGAGRDLVQEHESSAYDPARVWHYYNSRSEYVASAAWCETVRENTGFGGPADKRQTVRLLSAESDNLAALRRWCADQVEAGADSWRIHATWPIPEAEAPRGHHLHGKRENAFREGWSKPRD